MAESVDCSYRIQLLEGMDPLPKIPGALAKKYCGGGWGGYALYLFPTPADRDQFAQQPGALAIEPYLRDCSEDSA